MSAQQPNDDDDDDDDNNGLVKMLWFNDDYVVVVMIVPGRIISLGPLEGDCNFFFIILDHVVVFPVVPCHLYKCMCYCQHKHKTSSMLLDGGP